MGPDIIVFLVKSFERLPVSAVGMFGLWGWVELGGVEWSCWFCCCMA